MSPATLASTRRTPILTFVSATLVLGLGSGCPKARMVPSETCEPEPSLAACPEPEVVEPEVFPPMIHGVYAGSVSVESDSLSVSTSYDFVGPIVRVRVRYLSEPEGTIESSTYSTCEAEVEVPIRWTEHGFVVAQTVTVTAHRGDFERTEGEPLAEGSRQATHDKILGNCWVSVLEGEYRIRELSTTTNKGRPSALLLIEPDDRERSLDAVDPPSESDFIDRIDEYFWSR